MIFRCFDVDGVIVVVVIVVAVSQRKNQRQTLVSNEKLTNRNTPQVTTQLNQ